MSNSRVIDPHPLPEVELIFLIPFILANMDSSFDVASISTIRAELPGIEKLTVKPGRVRDGASLTGSNGINANPIIVTLKNATIMVKDDMLFFLLIIKTLRCYLPSALFATLLFAFGVIRFAVICLRRYSLRCYLPSALFDSLLFAFGVVRFAVICLWRCSIEQLPNNN